MDNMDLQRINDFIDSLKKDDNEKLIALKEYAKKNDVPIIRDETRDLIEIIVRLSRPKNVLEIGTAIGYSTLVINCACEFDANIDTIEDFMPRILLARENLKEYSNINLIEKDAGEFLQNNENIGKYDFIFLDAAKGQYINWLPYIKKLMKKDGILVADNILKDGEILESKFLIKKRNRTIHKRMRDYLYTVSNDNDLYTKILNIGDGVAISIKK